MSKEGSSAIHNLLSHATPWRGGQGRAMAAGATACPAPTGGKQASNIIGFGKKQKSFRTIVPVCTAAWLPALETRTVTGSYILPPPPFARWHRHTQLAHPMPHQ
jgi:hypothetical protein